MLFYMWKHIIVFFYLKRKDKKGVIMKKIRTFIKGVKKEIGRVRWPEKKEMIKYSVATVVFVLFFGLFFYVIDLVSALIRTLVG
jgi:preprotein translocase subunit SecE